MSRARIEMIGKEFNGWKVLREVGKNNHGAILFLCRCVSCGSEQIKTGGTIRNEKTSKCISCPPQYNFITKEIYAEGTLPDGTRFKIDGDMVGAVESLYWHQKGGEGYIISQMRGRTKQYLHKFVLGADQGDIVDHINRDKTDCRRENLRIVNAQQNASNNSILTNNTSGFVGVSWVSCRRKYMARIGYLNKDLTLGYYREAVRAAQAHDIAALFFFGEYMGHKNDVPDPTDDLIRLVKEKCRRFENRILRNSTEIQEVSFFVPFVEEVAV